MSDYLVDKDSLIAYIKYRYRKEYKKEISTIKLHIGLYLLYAMWGSKVKMARSNTHPNTEADELYGNFNEYLFDANFIATKFGPRDADIYNWGDVIFLGGEEDE